MLKICVFCGSSMGYGNEYRDAARKVGEFFAANNIELVYGGADVGLMKVMADTMLEKGSHVIGVMPGHLVDRGVVHHNLSQLITVETMAERKQKLRREDLRIRAGHIKMTPKELQAKRRRDTEQTQKIERARRRFARVMDGLRILISPR